MEPFVWIAIVVIILVLFVVSIATYKVFSIMIKSKASKDAVFAGRPPEKEGIVQQEKTVKNYIKDLFIEVTTESFDNHVLNAYQSNSQENNHEWVVCVHGYGGSPGNMAVYAEHFMEMGMNVLLPELRGHGKSKIRYYGLSYLDGYDINQWIRWILKKDNEARIVLFGISIGGASIAMASEFECHESVKCIITDSAPSSVHKQMQRVYSWMVKLPIFPIFSLTEVAIRVFAGFKLSDAAVIYNISTIQKPWLIIHGKEDGFVNVDMANELFEAATCDKKEMLLIDKADHVKSVEVNPILYWNRVDEFIKKSK